MEIIEKAIQKRTVVQKTEKSKTGEKRYYQIKSGIDRYKEAMDAGFYIEAIALMESAMSDRLESTLNYLFPQKDFSFKTVGFLAKCLSDNNLFLSDKLTSVLLKIQDWAAKRNDAIHQMVKLIPNKNKNFQERYNELKQCAEEGYVLFNELNNEKKKITRYQNKHPLFFKLKPKYKNVVKYPEVLIMKCKVADVGLLEDNRLYDQIKVFEDENGKLWRKKFLDIYYDLEKS